MADIDDGVSLRHLTVAELRKEVLKLQSLAIAVGRCSPQDVPDFVMKAWREPAAFRADELKWLREKYVRLVEVAASVVRQHDQGLAPCIDRLRLEITGSIR